MNILNEIKLVSEKLKSLILIDISNYDEGHYIDLVNEYLGALENWQHKYSNELNYLAESKRLVESNLDFDSNPVLESLRPEVKNTLGEIESNHNLIFERTQKVMSKIGDEMGRVSKNSKVIKKYLDILPMSNPNVKKEG